MARIVIGIGCCLLFSMAAFAQQENSAAAPGNVLVAQEKKVEGKKDDKKTQPPQVEQPDLSAALSSRADAPLGDSPHMLGELGTATRVLVRVPSLAFVRGQNKPFPVTAEREVRVGLFGRSGFKIGENEFVTPQDRAYFSYNYYNNFQVPSPGSDAPLVASQDVVINGQTVPALVLIPGIPAPRFDVSRQTFGFEKSFLDGNFSVGARVPMYQQNGGGSVGDSALGDMTFIAKYAPYLDRVSGSGVSVGLAVTVPTGPDLETSEGNIHATVWQPFVGYQLSRDRVLVYGFTSIGVPDDSRDVTLLFNDIGVGYRLLQRDGLITTVVPAFEVHVTTPLDHRKSTDVIQGMDLVVLTTGLHLGIGQRSLLTLGVATPVTGPRPYEVEGIVQFNFRF